MQAQLSFYPLLIINSVGCIRISLVDLAFKEEKILQSNNFLAKGNSLCSPFTRKVTVSTL